MTVGSQWHDVNRPSEKMRSGWREVLYADSIWSLQVPRDTVDEGGKCKNKTKSDLELLTARILRVVKSVLFKIENASMNLE